MKKKDEISNYSKLILDFKARFLELLAMSLGKDRETLKIYDPFFCQGSVVQHLQRLGALQKQLT